MGRMFTLLITLVVMVGIGAMMTRCMPDGVSAAPEPLAGLATATISARGLGPLVIHETTLGDVLTAHGAGRPEILFGDAVALELIHAEGGLRLMFSPAVHDPAFEIMMTRGARELVPALRRDAAQFVRQHPEVSALPLRSIAVREPFFAGATDRGVRLGDAPMSARRVHGGEAAAPAGSLLAGTVTTNGLPRPIAAPGLLFYPDRDETGGSHEVASPATLARPRRIVMIVAHGARGAE